MINIDTTFKRTWYNPELNLLKRSYSRPQSKDGEYFSLGYKKIAEAFTSVSIEERKDLWLSLHSKTYSFDFSMLNSKIKHKLYKLHLHQLDNRKKSPGEELLDRIKNKK